MRISLVVAIADNGVIGRAGGLPWHLPDDLKHFRALTLGKSVLMGRRTYESIGRPLPGRQNLIMSHAAPSPQVQTSESRDVQVVSSLRQAAACAREWAGAQAELCVIGGAQIYALAMAHAGWIHLTAIHARVAGDVQFPGYRPGGAGDRVLVGWQERQRTSHPPDARHAYAMSFVTLERTEAPAAV